MSKNRVETCIQGFLSRHLPMQGSLLVAVSGGSDSVALLLALLHSQKKMNFTLRALHIDHRFSSEGKERALWLRKFAEELRCMLEIVALPPFPGGENLEEWARKLRLQIFAERQQAHGADAVLLAHHRDDQRETTFKRILESAHLFHIGGMHKIQQQQGCILWRPCLELSKEELTTYLKICHKEYREDPANSDETILRVRMRKTIFPTLETMFGKSVQESLDHLSEEAHLLFDHLSKSSASMVIERSEGVIGLWLTFQTKGYSLLEYIFFLSRLGHDEGAILSRSLIKGVATALIAGKQGSFHLQRMMLFVDRGSLFLINFSSIHYFLRDKKVQSSRSPLPRKSIVLDGSISNSEWELFFLDIVPWSMHQESNAFLRDPKELLGNFEKGWRLLWQRPLFCYLPHLSYQVSLPQGEWKLASGDSLREQYRKKRVPFFLRERSPVFIHEERIVIDFLTGYIAPSLHPGGREGLLVKLTMGQKSLLKTHLDEKEWHRDGSESSRG